MPTIREYIENEVDKHRGAISELVELLYNLAPQLGTVGVGDLESDSVSIYGSWLILKDKSHKDLGSKIASFTDQSVRFKSNPSGTLRTAVFRDLGPFLSVDLDRPNPKCRKVRVLKPAEELEIEVCGDLPAGYELLEELE